MILARFAHLRQKIRPNIGTLTIVTNYMESTLNQELNIKYFLSLVCLTQSKKNELAQTLLTSLRSSGRFSLSFFQLESFRPSAKRKLTRRTKTKHFMLTSVRWVPLETYNPTPASQKKSLVN